jgi:hypothetical protein
MPRAALKRCDDLRVLIDHAAELVLFTRNLEPALVAGIWQLRSPDQHAAGGVEIEVAGRSRRSSRLA